MVNETNFIVRISGRKESSYYVDYQGLYKVTDLSKVTGINAPKVKEVYISNGGEYEPDLDIYYFHSVDHAKKAISQMLHNMKNDQKGKVVFLTEGEIEYIRQALINEGSNALHVSNNIKDAIFRKLNG